jgi:hypothetical protein
MIILGGNRRELGTAPRFHLLAHRLEVALHPINPDRDRVEQGKRLRVLCQDRSERACDNVSKAIGRLPRHALSVGADNIG